MPGRHGKQRLKRRKTRKERPTEMEVTLKDSIHNRIRKEKAILANMIPPTIPRYTTRIPTNTASLIKAGASVGVGGEKKGPSATAQLLMPNFGSAATAIRATANASIAAGAKRNREEAATKEAAPVVPAAKVRQVEGTAAAASPKKEEEATPAAAAASPKGRASTKKAATEASPAEVVAASPAIAIPAAPAAASPKGRKSEKVAAAPAAATEDAANDKATAALFAASDAAAAASPRATINNVGGKKSGRNTAASPRPSIKASSVSSFRSTVSEENTPAPVAAAVVSPAATKASSLPAKKETVGSSVKSFLSNVASKLFSPTASSKGKKGGNGAASPARSAASPRKAGNAATPQGKKAASPKAGGASAEKPRWR